MGLGVEDRLQKLVTEMKAVGYNSHMIKLAEAMVKELQQRSIYGINRFMKKLLDRVKNQDQDAYLDILREGRFAVILARNKFSEIAFIKEKQEQRLPDIKADWNRSTICFEVTRSRPSEEDKAFQAGALFVSQKSIENIISKIQEKISQLQGGEINIVVIWSDTINWLTRIMEEAFKCIQQEINQNAGVYEKLSGILFIEAGETCYPSQFKLFKNDRAAKPIRIRLAKKLESLSGQSPRELQKNMDEMADALRRV